MGQEKTASEDTTSDLLIVSVIRAFHVVEKLADGGDGLTFAELTAFLCVNQGICLRLLTTLEHLGYVYRQEGSGRYRLSYRINNLGLRNLSQAGILDQCSAVLRMVADRTGELARLALVDGDKLSWVMSTAGPNQQNSSLQINPTRSMRIGLHTHASGKAWLSTLPEKRVRALLGKNIAQSTTHSLSTVTEIVADIALARERGFVRSVEEAELGIGAVAAPILVAEINGEVVCVGTISVAAPTGRAGDRKLAEFGAVAKEAAEILAARWPLGVQTSG